MSEAWSPKTYTPGYVLFDAGVWQDMTDIGKFDVAGFLLKWGRGLLDAVPGVNTIVKKACFHYHVNPAWVLATLQKEQSLIESEPTEEKLKYAMGFGVTDSGARPGFDGFERQVRAACARVKEYSEPWADIYHIVQSKFRLSVVIDGVPVTPANLATAVCYTYTPHLHGNKLLWQLYRRYWPNR